MTAASDGAHRAPLQNKMADNLLGILFAIEADPSQAEAVLARMPAQFETFGRAGAGAFRATSDAGDRAVDVLRQAATQGEDTGERISGGMRGAHASAHL